MDVRVGLWRRLSTEESMLLNCGVGEDSLESLGLQEDPPSPFWRRSALGFLWKEWCWSWNSSNFGHLMPRVDSLEKTLMLGGIGGMRRRGRQRMRWLDGITDSMDMSLRELRALWPQRLAHQAPPGKNYWSGLGFPSPGDLPDPGTEPRSPTLQADSLPSEPLGKPHSLVKLTNMLFF